MALRNIITIPNTLLREKSREVTEFNESLGQLIDDMVDVVSCPTCGRTEYNSIALAEKIEKLTEKITKPLKIAVMGCVVNGPGEASDADIGVAGSKDYCVIFKKGEIYKRVAFSDIEKEFISEIEKIANEM